MMIYRSKSIGFVFISSNDAMAVQLNVLPKTSARVQVAGDRRQFAEAVNRGSRGRLVVACRFINNCQYLILQVSLCKVSIIILSCACLCSSGLLMLRKVIDCQFIQLLTKD
ncbi:uncharacterized protein LOC143530560 [Bidens hawaiensis]|uniref:uncharacterized protein LOC143530560 n=1 Tax=Bidens hawaiensis TaxID=980011 RepID=UPI00404A511C